MKVLHLTCNDARTGGAKAVHRLHTALLEVGVDSRVLLGGTRDQSSREVHVPRPLVWRAADKPARMLSESTGLVGIVRPSFRLWRTAIDAFGPDVVHIHWAYSGGTPPLVSLRSLASPPRQCCLGGGFPLVGGNREESAVSLCSSGVT